MTIEQDMNAVYSERNQIVAALSKLFPSYWFRDGEFPDWSVVCISLPTGQVTWHIPAHEMLQFFRHVGERANDWDGHTQEEKYNRLSKLEIPK